MGDFTIDVAQVRSGGHDATRDAEDAEQLSRAADTVRRLAAAAGSGAVESAGWAHASRLVEVTDDLRQAGRALSVGLRASAEAYAEVEERIDALFVPRWVP